MQKEEKKRERARDCGRRGMSGEEMEARSEERTGPTTAKDDLRWPAIQEE